MLTYALKLFNISPSFASVQRAGIKGQFTPESLKRPSHYNQAAKTLHQSGVFCSGMVVQYGAEYASITLNMALDERINIGTLMSNGTENIFKFSSEKLLGIKSLLSSEKYNLVKNYLKSLESDIHNISSEKINSIECYIYRDHGEPEFPEN